MANTPLQDLSGLPLFSQITPEQIQPAIEEAIAHCKGMITTLVNQTSFTWENFILPLEEADDQLSRIWSPVSHMNMVVSNDELRAAHDACLPLLSEYSTYAGQHKGLYDAYFAIANSDEFSQLNQAQQKVITDSLRDFKLSGVALEDEQKQRYGEISSRLSELSSQFSNHVLDATHAWHKVITDANELAGLPQSAIDAAKQAAEAKNTEGWVFTLDIPSYLPVMTYADNADLRQQMYTAFATRASDQGPNAGEFDNSQIINETLTLRQELARLLGFNHYAEHSLATKMADSCEQVIGFLEDLANRSKPHAEKDLAELRAFAKSNFGAEKLNAWDIAYYSEKLKQQKFSVSDEQLRPYFPEQNVINGLFEVVHRLYGLSIKARHDVDIWHKDVRFYDIFDQHNELRGSFYLDLYAREKKRGGAWMDECRTRRITANNTMQSPVAYLVCNLNPPVNDKPALFTHDEVITLFHEFGHGLHHMLTKVNIGAISGINGVPWDAVELPSQFLENWCWQKEALAFLSSHFETQQTLPKELLDNMLAAKNFQSSLQMLRQIEFSLFDFKLHQNFNAEQPTQVQSILDEVRNQVAMLIPPKFNRFQHSFGHIFAGGYAAGYYSYKWAEVLSADAFSRFEEEGIFNPEVGKSFLQNILEMGGSKSPKELFAAFRGREPQTDALLRHCGISA
jgi:oligopeptidase A